MQKKMSSKAPIFQLLFYTHIFALKRDKGTDLPKSTIERYPRGIIQAIPQKPKMKWQHLFVAQSSF